MKKIFSVFVLFLIFPVIHAQDFKFGKVSKEEVLEKNHPLDKEANAAVLYRNTNTFYEYYEATGFTLVTEVHERIKIYNKEGFEWANRKVNYYKNGNTREKVTNLKGNTYNIVNGKLVDEKLKKEGIFEEDVSKYQLSTKFTMPAVTEGSVIEYQYVLRSPFLTTIDDLILQYTIPANRMESSIRIPEFFHFQKHTNPRSPLPIKIEESKKNFSYNSSSLTRSSANSFTSSTKSQLRTSKVEYTEIIYKINQDAVPALKKESHIDYLSNYAAFLKWELQLIRFPNSPIENYSQTWEAVAKKIFTERGIEKEIERSNYFQKDLKELLAGETNPLIKAQMIYAFAKSKVKWNDYLSFEAENGANKAYKDGVGNVGDVNLMLIAMLRHAGLQASPVLLSTKNNGVPLFPTQKGFNYVVAGVELQDQLILLDATEENASFGELPDRARNWNGRIIRDQENSDWVNLMPQVQSRYKNVVNIKLESDKVTGKSTSIISGLYAKSHRDRFKNLNKENYLQVLEKNKGNIRISDIEIENQLELEEEIKQTYNFELEDGFENISDKIYLKPMLFLAEKENPFKADTRQNPIIFDFPSIENHTVNIMVPEGFEVESLPENSAVTINSDAGTFKFVILHNNNFIRVESVMDWKNIVFSPADYNALKQFYAHVVEKHSEAIVFKKI